MTHSGFLSKHEVGDGRQRGAESWWCLGLVGGGERDEEPVADLGAEYGDADAVGGEHKVSIMRMSGKRPARVPAAGHLETATTSRSNVCGGNLG